MKRPYVVINCAMSADRKISSPLGKQIRISCEEDIKRMYELRNESDAVLVGINTVLSDNPKLTVKEKYVINPKQPIRIVLDTDCKTPVDSLVVNDKAKTFIVAAKDCNKEYGKNVEYILCDKNEKGLINLKKLLDILYKRNIHRLMVEGGGTVIWNFLEEGLVDDFFVYIGPITIGGINTPTIGDGKNFEKFLKLVNKRDIGPGKLLHYKMII